MLFGTTYDQVTMKVGRKSGLALANTSTSFDFQMPEDGWIYGLRLLLSAQLFSDRVAITLVDKDNILGGGANALIYPIVEDYWITSSTQDQNLQNLGILVPAKSGTYVRFTYSATSLLTAVSFQANIFYLKPTSIGPAIPY